MASEFVPDVGGFIIIPETTFDIYDKIFKIFNCLSTKEARQYSEQNKKHLKHFMITKGPEMETLINKLVIPSLPDSKLLSNQLNKMREMKRKKILSMLDILQFLEAQYILKFTPKGTDIMEKVSNENN
tara:strand:+ start:94 stop:477 length:384 start_codon:yes stop_codon:yes gene_type:complete